MDRPRVPVEAAEHIIDFLALDVKTLRSCALVCRLWNPRSRFRLFYSIAVCPKSHRTPDALLCLFRSRPEVPAMVHSMTVHYQIFADSVVRQPSIHDVAVIVLLPYLPHLTQWRFRGCQYSSVHRNDPFVLRSKALMCLAWYSCSTTLRLEYLRFSRGDLSKIMSCFPQLQHLDCSTCHGDHITTHGGATPNIQISASQFPRKTDVRQLTVSTFYLFSLHCRNLICYI